MSICKKIKLYLTQNDISQTWLSEKIGLAIPKLNASLNGHRKLNADEFEAIVIALNVDANRFIKRRLTMKNLKIKSHQNTKFNKGS